MEGRNHYKKGLWTVEEDDILMEYIRVHGKGHWNRVAKMTGLKRCGKSCRLRWMNYLSPNIKRGDFSEEEDDLIIRLHKLLGNRWSLIAGRVPGRTDNQVKNHWNTHLSKKLGIKKAKRKIGASSQAHYREVGKTLSPTIDLDSKLPNDSNGGEECPQNVIEASDTQEQMMNPFFVSSSWYSNDDLNLNTPSLMEFLDGYPLDLVWPGL